MQRSTPSPLERLTISIRSICSGAGAQGTIFPRVKAGERFFERGALIDKEKAYPAGIRVSDRVSRHGADAEL